MFEFPALHDTAVAIFSNVATVIASKPLATASAITGAAAITPRQINVKRFLPNINFVNTTRGMGGHVPTFFGRGAMADNNNFLAVQQIFF